MTTFLFLLKNFLISPKSSLINVGGMNLFKRSEKSFSGTSLRAFGSLIIFIFLEMCSRINVVFIYC